VIVFQSPDTELDKRQLDDKASFGLAWLLTNRMQHNSPWPPADGDGMIRVRDRIIRKIYNIMGFVYNVMLHLSGYADNCMYRWNNAIFPGCD